MTDPRFEKLYQWRRDNEEAFKVSRRERTRRWRNANPDKVKEQQRRNNERRKLKETEETKDRRRCRALQKNYGITLDRYNELMVAQNFQCAICKTTTCPTGRSFAVDHCHTTLVVRGLLCKDCNIGLGMFKHHAERLRLAAEYLEESE